jgi:ferredoxin
VPAALQSRTVRIAGTASTFEWRPDDGSLLDAAPAAGLSLPSGCRVGRCQSCAVTVVKGEVAHLGQVESVPGQRLAGQAVPLAELTLSF